MSVCYKVSLAPEKHIYNVTLGFLAHSDSAQLSLPVWIPGSYMVREFSKNIVTIHATQEHHEVTLEQTNKNTWLISGLKANHPVSVSYQVYAYEYGIRTAFLDTSRGYFNPTSLCLAVDKQEQIEHIVEIVNLPRGWQSTSGLRNKVENIFVAKNYDELLDSPFELGTFERYKFTVAGVPHYLVLSGTILPFDKERILGDMYKVCEYQIDLFGGVAPYEDYTFILNLTGEVYTGLEHRNSTLLMAPYYALPNQNKTNEEDYIKLMGLISHEFFHTWNVKRIKPQVFTPYDVTQENYTKLLWWFEGVTSYYDDLVMYRSGVIERDKYLGFIVDNINNVYKFNGVNKQSIANSSLTSWVKYYRQDENSPNSIVSYYVKGALVALCLDLLIRQQSEFSLDDVLRYMYNEWQRNPIGIGENEVPAIIKAATGVDLTDFIKLATESTELLPLIDLFADYGLALQQVPAKNHQDSGKFFTQLQVAKPVTSLDLGAKLEKQALGYLVKNVYNNTPAEQAGLAVNDLVVAINGLKLTNLERQLAFITEHQAISLAFFRQDRLLDATIKPCKSAVLINNLVLNDESLLASWL